MVYMLYWYICYIGISVILVYMLYWYICYICIYVILVYMLYMYICCQLKNLLLKITECQDEVPVVVLA